MTAIDCRPHADIGDAIQALAILKLSRDHIHPFQWGALAAQADVGRRHTQLTPQFAPVHNPAADGIGTPQQRFSRGQPVGPEHFTQTRTADALTTFIDGAGILYRETHLLTHRLQQVKIP